ncbi:hypothetical protein [Ramlibacter sp.]|uniref:hypothetical protein n=1 Tax=Ramlibacter sp. TaxID=1917967 RepID=UPI0026190BA3|nr:hypothetical protein [Ramlibacter sp.]MDB5957218.1 hypothetical protein [Ramlibacter sp.]
MTAIAQDFWQEQADEPEVRIDGRIDVAREDAYWQSAHTGESYYRAECNYEQDYAPAYCVGYIGFVQYGDRFEEAEKSLCANWVRIKGESRLTVEEAMQAIRAAWLHAAAGSQVADAEHEEEPVQASVPAGPSRAAREAAYATA